MKILEAEHISKTYPIGKNFDAIHALEDTTISFEEETMNIIIGRSGSGKSTLLHILGGLDEPSRGKVLLEGKDIYSLNDKNNTILRRRRIGFIYQFYNLIPDLTVYENIVLPLHIDHQKEDPQYIQELLEFLGIEDKKDAMPDTLSGGQQQRVAIARALAMKPAIILADEPTGNLDKKSGEEVITLLLNAKHKYHSTIIIVTHDQSVSNIADRVITLEDGKVISDTHPL